MALAELEHWYVSYYLKSGFFEIVDNFDVLGLRLRLVMNIHVERMHLYRVIVLIATMTQRGGWFVLGVKLTQALAV